MKLRDLIATTPPGVHYFLRVRDPKWANPHAYMRLSIVRHPPDPAPHVGPWVHLFDRATQRAIGEPTPQALCLVGRDQPHANLDANVDVYYGRLDASDEQPCALVALGLGRCLCRGN